MAALYSKREQYAQTTRQALLDTGLTLFLEHGYANVPAEDLVRAAGLTRGALYHHFDGKRGLFEAVFEDMEMAAAERIVASRREDDDPWERALVALRTFLDVCTDRTYREIVLLQGPIALGWERWRELDRRHLGALLLGGVLELREADLLVDHTPELVAAAVYGALTELSMVIAQSDHPARAREEANLVLLDLLRGLCTDPDHHLFKR